MTQPAAAIAATPAPTLGHRDFYIDRLRTVMTALVIFHHTAITYGAIGGWFWRETPPSGSPSSILLILFCSTNQAYFMGFFFLLAGYFTPAALERKGYPRFIADRFLRLGIPLLAFIVILGPLTAAIVTWAQGDGFWPTIISLYRRQRIINGPLWFAEALLIFSLAYCAWRPLFGSSLAAIHSPAKQLPTPVPAYRWWLISALATAAAALAIRQFFPVGENVFGLQLAYFAGYIFLFVLGIAAWRHDWLRRLGWKQARPWIITLFLAWPALPVGITILRATHAPGGTDTSRGISLASTLYALWEPFVAWGLIAAWLLILRKYWNKSSPLWNWLNRRAYAVYILHPPVLVSVSLWLRPWLVPALVKFAVTGTLSCAICWLISDPLVRIPGIKRIV